MGTAANVIVGQAQTYLAPANTASPVITALTGLVVTPSAPWVAVGFTENGVTINNDRKVNNNIMVEEQSTPILVVPDSTMFTIDIAFAEDTILNMQTAYGGGTITTVAASVSQVPETILTLADALTAFAMYFVATSSAGLARTIYIPNVISAGKVKTSYVRAKANRQYAATFTAVCPLNSIVISDVTGPHS